MKGWPKEAYGWYYKACKMFDYPAGPYGKALRELISKDDTVLDLGCGIGAASVMISPWCKKVIAMDQDENALHHLAANARELNLGNIEILHDSWPPVSPIKADVIIALHVQKAMRSLSNIRLVFESSKKGGFIASQVAVSRQEEPFCELKEALGIPPNHEKCDNGCYVKGALEALGASAACGKKVYDFGQPLDAMDEVVQFISWQIELESPPKDSDVQKIKEYANRYAEKAGGKYLVPIERHCCTVSFLKL